MKTSTDSLDPTVDEGKGRPWARISLKTVLLIVAVLCVWLAVFAKKARNQQLAIDRIDELGGIYLYEFEEYDAKKNEYFLNPFGPDWVYDLIGIDYAGSVISADFSRDEECNPSNDDLSVLNNLPDLRGLFLEKCKQIDDDGLIHLAGLSELEELSLTGTNVINNGLRHITSLRELRILDLSNTPLFDSGLKHIGELPNLEFLDLTNTRITKQGLKHLDGLTSLTGLRVPAAISDEDILPLKLRLPQCQIEGSIYLTD